MAQFLLKDEAVLVGAQFVVDHLVDLVLQEDSLLLVKCGFLVELGAEGVPRHLEVVLDHHEGVLQPILQDLQLFLHQDQLFPGLRIRRAGCGDVLLEVGLSHTPLTMRFLMGTSLSILIYYTHLDPLYSNNSTSSPLRPPHSTSKVEGTGGRDWGGRGGRGREERGKCC